MVEQKIFAKGGLDLDSAKDYVAVNDLVGAWNFRVTGNREGEEGDSTDIESNQLIPCSRPSGINKTVGAFGFELVRKAYSFVYNSQGLNLITELDYDTLTESIIFTNLTDSGGVDILPLNPQFYVTDCKLVQDRYLIFTFSGAPYYLDLQALKNGSLGVIVQEDFLLVKGQPLTEPTAVYNDDSGRQKNDLKNRLFQFRSQKEKLSYEKTAWSTISKRPVPINEPTPTFGTNVTINNNIIVSVDAGTTRDRMINVAARYDMLDWFLIASKERADIIALPDTMVDVEDEIYEAYDPATNIYSFAFYNDGLYENIDPLETDEGYDHIPQKVETLEVINGSILALGGLTEGYDRPTVQVELSVSSYDPNITVPTVPVDSFRIVGRGQYRVSGSHRRFVSIDFSGLPKTGDKIYIQLRDIRDYSVVQNYEYTVEAPQEGNRPAVLALLSTKVPNSSVNVDRLQILTDSYFELSSASISLANAGSGASKSIPILKSNSSYQVALAHYDTTGYYFPINTDETYVKKTPSYAFTHGLVSQINWTILSHPPVGAATYQWLLSLNNTHATDLYVNGSYDASRSTNDYVVFNIKSLKKFNDTNSSSVLNYDYSAGDRATFQFTFLGTNNPIKWFDTQAIDVEVVGFEIVVDTAPEPDVTNYFLKVRKSSALLLTDIVGKEVLLEIYSPKKRTTTTDGVTTNNPTLFFEIGDRYNIVNGAYEVTSGVIRDGDAYFKTRGLTGNLDPNTLYLLNVEDFNFSDFYKSDYTSYGRPRSYDDEIGKVERLASIRYSDTYVTGGKVNGLTRFYGARIYGDGPGETSSVDGLIRKIRIRGNTLICIQELDVWHIPVNISIVEDQVEQRQYAISDKLLNFVRPTFGRYGIGDAKESYAESQNGTIYFTDPNNSLPIRDGADGLSVIAPKMTKYFRRVLKDAKKNGRKIIGIFDVYNDEYIVSIEVKAGVLTNFVFNSDDWSFTDSYEIVPADLAITSNSNGVTVLNGDGTATFTPDPDYAGVAGFTFTFLDGDGNIVTKKSCGTVEAGVSAVNSFYFIDLVNQEQDVLIESNSILISGNNIPSQISIVDGEYSVNGGAWTSSIGTVGNGDTVMVRRSSSPALSTTVSTVLTVDVYSDSFDITTHDDTYPDEFDFDDQVDVPESTLIVSNTVTMSGISTTLLISVVNGEYRINGGSWVSTAGEVSNGDDVEVRVMSASTPLTDATVYLNVGSYSADFVVVTAEEMLEIYTLSGAPIFVGESETAVNAYLKDGSSNPVTVSASIAFTYEIDLTYIATGEVAPSITGMRTLTAGISAVFMNSFDPTVYNYVGTSITGITPNNVDGHPIV